MVGPLYVSTAWHRIRKRTLDSFLVICEKQFVLLPTVNLLLTEWLGGYE